MSPAFKSDLNEADLNVRLSHLNVTSTGYVSFHISEIRILESWAHVTFDSHSISETGVRGIVLASYTDVRGFEPQCGERLSCLTC